MSENLNKGLMNVQRSLVATKNKDGYGYKYRSCEDILQALKKPLFDNGLAVIISDDIVEIGGRIYIKATATITDGIDTVSTAAFAREPEAKNKMDLSQITGSASSYARKYALCGLCAVDNNKDADDLSVEQANAKPVDKPVKKTEVKAEVKLPAYPQSDFEDNQKAWAEAIKVKKTTPQILIAKMSTRGVLSDEQKQTIEGFAK